MLQEWIVQDLRLCYTRVGGEVLDEQVEIPGIRDADHMRTIFKRLQAFAQSCDPQKCEKAVPSQRGSRLKNAWKSSRPKIHWTHFPTSCPTTRRVDPTESLDHNGLDSIGHNLRKPMPFLQRIREEQSCLQDGESSWAEGPFAFNGNALWEVMRTAFAVQETCLDKV